VEESAIANMYNYVLQQLYSINTGLLLGNNILKITRNKEDFRSAQEITNGYFVEFNIDSNTKFNILKKLLSLFDLEDELIIKYDNGSSYGTSFYVRKAYWQQLFSQLQEKGQVSNVKPVKYHCISMGAGKTGLKYSLPVTGSHCQIELSILTANRE